MLKIKKILALMCIINAQNLLAGTMGPVCTEENSTIPCKQSSWQIGADALLLQPSLGEFTLPLFLKKVSSNVYQYESFNPSYGWGFKLEGAYHFNTGNDLNINWYQLNHGNHFTTTNGLIYNSTITSLNASSTVDVGWNAVNVELGQLVKYGESKSIRFHGGVGYVRILENMLSVGTDANAGIVNAVNKNNGSYNGFGPRVGADLHYNWQHGLGLYANTAVALFVGNKGFTDIPDVNASSTFSGAITSIVPELEAKLGGKYTHATSYGDLTFDLGWMWINYFNAHMYQNQDNNVVEDNFGLQGLFFGMKWLGNIG